MAQRYDGKALEKAAVHGICCPSPALVAPYRGGKVCVSQHGRFGFTGGAAGILQNGDLRCQIASLMALELSIVIDELAETDFVDTACVPRRRKIREAGNIRRRGEILDRANDEFSQR